MLILLAVVSLPPQIAEPQEMSEYKVKAGYLLTFTRYAEWTGEAAPAGSIVIGILGDDPFGPSIDAVVRGRSSQGLPVTVRRSQKVDAMNP